MEFNRTTATVIDVAMVAVSIKQILLIPMGLLEFSQVIFIVMCLHIVNLYIVDSEFMEFMELMVIIYYLNNLGCYIISQYFNFIVQEKWSSQKINTLMEKLNFIILAIFDLLIDSFQQVKYFEELLVTMVVHMLWLKLFNLIHFFRVSSFPLVAYFIIYPLLLVAS